MGAYHLSLNNLFRKGYAVYQAYLPKQEAALRERRQVKRLRYLADELGLSDPIVIVDIGANPLDFDAPYKALMRADLCTVVGFEPQKEAFDTLQSNKSASEIYINEAVGNGETLPFYQYESDGLSSLFKLDPKARHVFSWLENPEGVAYNLVSDSEAATKRVDDIAEIKQIDFLKIDIQGGELAVFQNARQKMAKTIAVQTEMRWCKIYENEPHFGEVDVELNEQGFEMHCLYSAPQSKFMPHSQSKHIHWSAARQLIDEDFIYVRALRDLEQQDPVFLKKLAILADAVFDSVDLVFQCLDILAKMDEAPKNLAKKYRQSLPFNYLK